MAEEVGHVENTYNSLTILNLHMKDVLNSERKPRKSVAFSEGTTVVDSNGDVTEMNGTSDKTTAESHTAG